MFIVGIDIAKRTHVAAILSSEGETVCKPFSFKNSCSGYNQLLDRMKRLSNHITEFVIAMESTAHYWMALYTRLRREGFNVVLLNPIQTHAMRELLIREIKTDAVDAVLIAESIRFGHYSVSSVPQDRMIALRELCRNRTYLMDAASDLKRKIVSILDLVFPEYETLFETMWGKTSLAILNKYPTPEKLIHAQLRYITKVLQESSNGRFGEWKAKQLREAAKGSFGVPDCQGVYSTLLTLYLRQMQNLLDEAAELEKAIRELFLQFPNQLTTISGIGPILGAVILSEIRDISLFSSADKLAAYAGVDPVVKQSGELKFGEVHMSKRGSPYLRRAIWAASMVAVQRDPMFHAYYEKKSAEGMRYMKIIGHVTKKMTAVIYAVMRDNQAYTPVLPVA